MNMEVIWVSRKTWGATLATEKFIADRVSDSASIKTEIHVHHTAAIDDDDSTPNRWDYDEAVAYMRRLEWVRPDLGPLPYSENYAVNEAGDRIWVFQGRGWLKRGAHTGGHNVKGVGLAALGNFNKTDAWAAEAIIYAMQERVAGMRKTIVPHLGDTKSPRGWNAWGHRDSKATSCPGFWIYRLLEDFSLEENPPTQGEDAMLPLQVGDNNEDVRLAKDRMNIAYGLSLDLQSTAYGQPFKRAVATHLAKYTGEEAGQKGEKINARMWNGLLKDYIQKTAPTQPVTGVTTAQVTRMIRDTRLLP